MRSFAINSPNLEEETLMEFAQWTVSPNTLAVQGLMDRMHLLVTGSRDLENLGSKGVLRLVAASLQVISNHK